MGTVLSLAPGLLGLLGGLLGVWLAARWTDRRERRKLEADREALDRRAEHERAAARAAWVRERRYEVHQEVLSALRAVRLELAPLARGQATAVPEGVLKPLLPLRSRLDLVASQDAVAAFDRVLAAMQEARTGKAVRFLGAGRPSDVFDVDLHLRAYIEWARLDLDQEVDRGELPDRTLAQLMLESRHWVAEQAARDLEAEHVAAMRC